MVLIPVSDGQSSSLSGLSGLAAMAGVSLSSGGSMTPDVAFQSLLNNYEFMRNFVIKHQIVEHYEDNNLDKNYVFAGHCKCQAPQLNPDHVGYRGNTLQPPGQEPAVATENF